MKVEDDLAASAGRKELHGARDQRERRSSELREMSAQQISQGEGVGVTRR
jgi:hypothetical protein